MAFVCPECLQGRLTITNRLELEGDSRSDDITLQLLDCVACGFGAIAVYEESRRGALDSESSDHYGYKISDADLQNLRVLFEHCPYRQKVNCDCVAHWALNRYDATGRWDALESYEKSYFAMRYIEN